MTSLWFCVPAHGRLELSRICLTQLRRTCDALCEAGVIATAVVIADDENLDTARALGFATVEQDNNYLSRRFNDGIQRALDPRHNPHPADYVVPCGSDDWVDHRIFLDLPEANTMVGFQRLAIVREDGAELTTRHLTNPGGSGIRIYPRALMEPVGYRPADEHRRRACDTSIFVNLVRYHGSQMRIMHHYLHDYQIVDWKSRTEQLNSYEQVAAVYRGTTSADPFQVLADYYPADLLEQMQDHYQPARKEAAAHA